MPDPGAIMLLIFVRRIAEEPRATTILTVFRVEPVNQLGTREG
jgi:hypothetical protein